MKIFLTGASGFIGGAVAKHLASKHEIHSMARSELAAQKVAALGTRPVRCDLTSITPENLSNCETVIHSAAYAEEWGSEQDFHAANVLGTQKLLEAAKAAGVKRFIFIGTEAAFFHGQDMIDVDESYPYADHSPYPYSRTKAKAERLVLAANAPEFTTISLRPRMVWGPDDQSILPAVLAMIAEGRFAWIGGGDFQSSTTHIKNLVHGIELALTKGEGGNAYFLANDEVVQVKDFLRRYIATQGVRVPDKSVPKFVARLVAHLTELVWKLFSIKKKPPLVRFSIDIMSADCTLKIDKARRELGYKSLITTDEGLATMTKLNS